MQLQQQTEMVSFGGSNNEQAPAEAASPISSRPPAAAAASSSTINFEELAEADQQHDHHNQGGGGGSGSTGGNSRWPRQETLALLKIRSEMDVAFRDNATLKGPLWDDVSRKLGELGYIRSAKKCKEKFENVHKYYKRTKEDRAARHDRKTYRFFTQLEAMQPPPPPQPPPPAAIPTTHQHQQVALAASCPPITTTTVAAPVQFATPVSLGLSTSGTGRVLPPFTTMHFTTSGSTAQPAVGTGFSSDRAFSDSDNELESDDDDEDQEDIIKELSNPKRKRSSSSSSSGILRAGKRGRMMMEFFEGLMKKVMQKQEAMQQKFMETIEKREHDRLMREEAWKQNEAAKLRREQELAAKERAMAASRDAIIVSFFHKITGQTIQLPPPQPQPPQPLHGSSSNLQSRQQQHTTELVIRQQQTISPMPPPPVSSEIIMAIPERQIPPSSQSRQELTISSRSVGEAVAAAASRWPKAEILALINLRSSNLENWYEEAGPKGPLWEEISAGMQRIGYNRSSKRCKEKWENINKYFKKVKEGNKKRPQDAKTCPYYNELDALYQRKKLTGSGGGSSSGNSMMVQFQQQQQQQQDHLGIGQEGSRSDQLQRINNVGGS